MADGMELNIDVSIADYRGGGNLRLSERVMISNADFGTLAEIMGKFHALLTTIKEARDSGEH